VKPSLRRLPSPSLRRLPSPALVISCVALFVSLGGVSYGVATGFIDSREIKNNTIRSKDVRNNTLRTFDIRNNEVRGFDVRNSTIQGRDVAFNTLTGADISESSLAKVPSAAAADTAGSANTATSADTVGGVTMRRFNYAAEAGSGPVQVLDFGGLRLEASCGAGGMLQVRGTPADPNSEVSVSSDLVVAAPTTFADPLVDEPGAGVIAFAAPSGAVVTIQALAIEAPPLNSVQGTTNDCGFFGIAEAG
jgi:hypothetical protein